MNYNFIYILLFLFLPISYSCHKPSPQEEKKLLPKNIKVFDLNIFASETTSDLKIIHAAKIMAQYLDNDEDGIVDNKLVHEMLVSRNATLLMFNNESEAEAAWMSGEYNFSNNSQLLFDDETIPSFNSNAPNRRFDASLEEVLHLITHEGYSYVYPDLKEVKGSSIAKAMDEARGGYFQTPPSQYPSNAWYSYDDITCTYDCMIVEYFYWALTSILGAQSYPGRINEIGHEWKLNTKEKVENLDTLIFTLMTNLDFNLPKVLPDNDYKGFEIKLEN